MAPIRYSLHYEDYSEHLMSRFGKLLQMQSLVDMTLMCSSHTLRVHKVVLSASSGYFQEILQKQVGEPLIILKMRFSVLKSLVEFMYCGKTQCLEDNLDELVSAAQFLKIKGLSKVTKEGLNITNGTDLPQFPAPVVICRPSQDLQDMRPPPPDAPDPKVVASQYGAASSNTQAADNIGRPNKEMVVRIPFGVDKRSAPPGGMDYPEPPRPIKPRRGRPSRSGAWEQGNLGRAAERALMRREQDSRKAIHHLKHLQNKQMQDYMDQVTLSQAVNSICGLESSSNHNYMNMDSDFMFMDQAVSTNVLDINNPYSKEHNLAAETIASSYSAPNPASNDPANGSISSAMSQYVDALKNAGLPTDLPILFESGDGSYINVNEQVLLDMVQSNEIQYEVIEQPNIIKNVANPNDIKSIDDLSKSIERGEILINDKSFGNSYNYEKDSSHYNRNASNMTNLNPILSDNLESFADQQNFVVLDSHLQDANNSMDQGVHDLSGIDSDVNFFTKSISDDVKKYYENSQLDEARVMEQLCPTSTLDTSFSISLLDSKGHNLDANADDLRRNEDCYDFGLHLQSADALECLMSTPKRSCDRDRIRGDDSEKQRAAIMKDLMNIESNMNIGQSHSDSAMNDNNVHSNIEDFSIASLNNELNYENKENISSAISSTSMHWESLKVGDSLDKLREVRVNRKTVESSLMGTCNSVTNDSVNTSFDDVNIPLAVGLLPLKQSQSSDEEIMMKRKNSVDDYLINDDSKCLKRKVKYKKY